MADAALRVLERAAALGDPSASERLALARRRAGLHPPLDGWLIGQSSTGTLHLAAAPLHVVAYPERASNHEHYPACGSVASLKALRWEIWGGPHCCLRCEGYLDEACLWPRQLALAVLLELDHPHGTEADVALRRLERELAELGRWVDLHRYPLLPGRKGTAR